MRRRSRPRLVPAVAVRESTLLKSRYAAHGVTMKAMASEKSIAAEAPVGMGRM